MTRVLFLCTGNTCRSQMAEGFARAFGRGVIEAYSAGLAPAGEVHPRAIAVMKEQGIDISQQKSKGIDIGILRKADVIITLCGHAEESCPWTSTQIKRIHWPIKDPVRATGTDEEIMNEVRTSRDDIRKRLLEFIEERTKGGVHGE